MYVNFKEVGLRQSMIMDDTFPFVKSKLVEWANTHEMLLQIHLSILRNYNKQSHRIILVPDHIGWYLVGVAEWGV